MAAPLAILALVRNHVWAFGELLVFDGWRCHCFFVGNLNERVQDAASAAISAVFGVGLTELSLLLSSLLLFSGEHRLVVLLCLKAGLGWAGLPLGRGLA